MISRTLENIDQFPLSIRSVISEYSNKLLDNLDDNLRAILVYGSAAGINYNPLVSNINFAVIAKNIDFSLLNQNLGLIKWGHKRKIATPLFLTKEYILSALDVFPIEFTEIKEKHQLIYGEDVFNDLQIPVKDLRLLCEQQVKGKLLHLRQAYLEIGHNPSILKNLLLSAFKDLVPVFRQIIFLKDQKPNEHTEEMLGQLAKIFNLDHEPFLAVYHDKNKKALISSNQLEAHLQNFLVQLEKLSFHMDSL